MAFFLPSRHSLAISKRLQNISVHTVFNCLWVDTKKHLYCKKLIATRPLQRNYASHTMINASGIMSSCVDTVQCSARPANHQSPLSSLWWAADEQPDLVTKNLLKEVTLGWTAGPFLSPPFQNFQIYPIGVVPKKHSSDWRTIFHLSHPKSSSTSVQKKTTC